MLYSFEMQMMGVILFTAMTVGWISLWLKRRKDLENIATKDDSQNST